MSVTVRVSDNGSPALTAETSFDINVLNVAPVLQLSGAATAKAGLAYTVSYTVSDPGTDTLQRLLVNWGDGLSETVQGNPGQFSHTYALRDGDYTISVRPVDEDGTWAPATLNVSMQFNDPPVAVSRLLNLDEDSPLAITLTGSDPEGEAISFSLVQGPQHGTLSDIDPTTGQATYTPFANYNGPDNFVFRVTDAQGASDTGFVNLVVRPVNDLPQVQPVRGVALDEGQTLSLQMVGSDIDAGDTLSWSLDEAPQGATIDPTGLLQWQATDGDASYTFTVRATDSQGGSSVVSFAAAVRNVAPTLSLSGADTVLDGVSYGVQFSRTDPGQDTVITWVVDWGDGSTSTLAGNASQASHVYAVPGQVSITVTATDEDGSTTSAPLVLQVLQSNRPPVAGTPEFRAAATG